MKEVKLSKSDFRTIADIAHKKFIERGISYAETYENFLCKCYVEAIKTYLGAKGWIMKNGKIHEAEE